MQSLQSTTFNNIRRNTCKKRNALLSKVIVKNAAKIPGTLHKLVVPNQMQPAKVNLLFHIQILLADGY